MRWPDRLAKRKATSSKGIPLDPIIQVQAKCKKCETWTPQQEMIASRPVEDFPDLTEVGILCPNCRDWTHANFEGKALAAFRQKLSAAQDALNEAKAAGDLLQLEAAREKFRRAKQRMGVEHYRFNTVWRKKLGVKSPKELGEEARAKAKRKK